MFRLCNRAALLILALGTLAGCTESSGPKVEYVEGIVTLDGQPQEGVIVTFQGAGEGGNSAVGTTNAQGVYTLTAMPVGAVGKGAPAGDYNVSLIKTTTEAVSQVAEDDPNYQSGTAQGATAPQAPKTEVVIPVKYNNAATSGIKVTVKSGTNKGGEFNFDVKKE